MKVFVDKWVRVLNKREEDEEENKKEESGEGDVDATRSGPSYKRVVSLDNVSTPYVTSMAEMEEIAAKSAVDTEKNEEDGMENESKED